MITRFIKKNCSCFLFFSLRVQQSLNLSEFNRLSKLTESVQSNLHMYIISRWSFVWNTASLSHTTYDKSFHFFSIWEAFHGNFDQKSIQMKPTKVICFSISFCLFFLFQTSWPGDWPRTHNLQDPGDINSTEDIKILMPCNALNIANSIPFLASLSAMLLFSYNPEFITQPLLNKARFLTDTFS